MIESRIGRSRQASADAALAAIGDDAPPPNAALAVAVVDNGAFPSAGNRYFAVKRLDLSGAETEGGAATSAAVGVAFLAFNLGGNIPPINTQLIVRHCGSRWVFRY